MGEHILWYGVVGKGGREVWQWTVEHLWARWEQEMLGNGGPRARVEWTMNMVGMVGQGKRAARFGVQDEDG